ncbi:MAG: hypothetical protein ACXV3U_02925 [Halobacteriota archaeon]
MDELILGLAVGSFFALCLGLILKTVGKSRERKQRKPKSKMTTREKRVILVTSFMMVVILALGIGAFFVL